MAEPETVNAVGGGNLNRELDLQKLHDVINGYEVRYEPEHWPGLYIRFRTDSPAIMVFRTGNYNIAGADSVEELLDENKKFLSRLDNLGIGDGHSFEIRNLVFLDRYDKELKLDQVAIGLGLENTEYEPEQFPGLLFRPPDVTGSFLLFRNGKVILTGADNQESAVEAFRNLFERLDSLFN